jgi:uncharacterized membrane protein (UPF0127 family)
VLVLSDLESVFNIPWKKLRLLLLFLVVLSTALVLLASRIQSGSAQMHLQAKKYTLEVVSNGVEKQKGLGGLVDMPQDQGMLFLSDTSNNQCYWMKDMHFAIDIIWLSAEKKINYIEHNVQPKTYPKSFCHPAKYVIELNAGEAAYNRLKLNQAIKF